MQTMNIKPLMILIAGPYRSGTGDDPQKMADNLNRLESVALPLFRAGHVPMIGEWVALPLLQQAGSRVIGDMSYDEIVYPTAKRLLAHCDAVLRLPGESKGADEDVRLARARNIPVYFSLHDVPGCESIAGPRKRAEVSRRRRTAGIILDPKNKLANQLSNKSNSAETARE